MKARLRRKRAKEIAKKLLVLCYANNNAYTTVLTLEEALKKFGKHFAYDYRDQKWSWQTGPFGEGNGKYPVGRDRYTFNSRYGVIGVYDSAEAHLLKSIDALLHASKQATREVVYESPCSD